jgi:hypothetical protein
VQAAERGADPLVLADARRRVAIVLRRTGPDQVALDQGDPQAAAGQLAGAVLARRAAAHDDDVVVGHADYASVTSPARPTLNRLGQSGVNRR